MVSLSSMKRFAPKLGAPLYLWYFIIIAGVCPVFKTFFDLSDIPDNLNQMKFKPVAAITAIAIITFNNQISLSQTDQRTSPIIRKTNTLWYTQAAKRWEEALPIGNGSFGAMIFGGPAHEKLQLNEITVWSGDPQTDADRPDAYKYLDTIRKTIRSGAYTEAQRLTNNHFTSPAPYNSSYQTLGNLTIDFKLPDAPISNYVRSLNINEAISRVSFETGGVAFSRETFASNPDKAIVQKLTASKRGSLSFKLALSRIERAKTQFLSPNKLLMNGNTGGSLNFAVQLQVINKGGSVQQDSSGLSVTGADEAIIIMTAGTSYMLDYAKGFKGPMPQGKVSQQLAAATRKSYQALRSNHISEYQKYFHRVRFQLGNAQVPGISTIERLKSYGDGIADPAFATLFYQYGRYLLISSSRPDNLLPSNSQGLWGDGLDLPWKCDYKSNINYQMNYWMAEQTNLSEMHLPMLRFTQSLAVPGTKTAKAYYGPSTPGWFYGYTTNGWGWTSPGAYLPWGVFAGGSGWACQHLWEHYAFTGDRKYLAEVYPTLKGAAEFYIATLIPDNQGKLVTSPSTSPENFFITDEKVKSSVTEGATMEKSIVWDLLNNVVKASNVLDIDADFRKKAAEVRDRISPLKIGKNGQLLEWNQDWDLNSDDPHHRHVSHLFALHPGKQITVIGTPDLAAAAKRTLQLRGDDGTGWSIAWKENFWARLRDGDHAHKLLSTQLRYTDVTKTVMADAGGTYANLFDAHPPFQIDGNFGAVSGMTEMLLQSAETFTNDKGETYPIIDLLPALPSAWPNGEISGLRARGGYEVSLRWKAGMLASATVISLLGGTCQIRSAIPLKIKAASKLERKSGYHHYQISSRKGETILILPE